MSGIRSVKPTLVALLAFVYVGGLPDTLGADSKGRLQLRLVPTKTSLLVGEPFVVTLVLTGEREVYLTDPYVTVVVKTTKGSRPYRAKRFVSSWDDPPKPVPLGAEPITMDFVLAVDQETNDWAFPSAGRYGVVAVYREPNGFEASSNTVELDVGEPEGTESRAWEALFPFRETALAFSTNAGGPLGELAPIASQYPASVYLALPRLNDLRNRVALASQGLDPYDPRALWIVDRAVRQESARAYFQMLVPVAEDLAAQRDSPFRADALAILAMLQRQTGNAAASRATFDKIVREYPLRSAAKDARRELEGMAKEERVRNEENQ